MSRLRLAVLSALTLALLLTGVTGLAPRAGAVPAAPAGPQAPQVPSVEVHLRSVAPGIARPGRAVRFTGTVENATDHALRNPVVQVRVSGRGLDTRARLADWADGTDTGPTGDVAGRTSIRGPLLPGEELPFTLRVGPRALRPGLSFGTLPATVEVVPGMPVTRRHGKRKSAARTVVVPQPGATPLGSLRTFLPWDASHGYHRIRMSWVVPLTLPSNPALFGAAGKDRTAAWEAAIGPGSRIDRLLTGTAGAPVTYALDPVMVSPYVQPAPNAATPSPSSSGSGSTGPSGSPTTPGAGDTASEPSTGSATAPPTDTPTEGSGSTSPSGTTSETSPTPNAPSSSSSPTTPPPPNPEQRIATLAADLAARLNTDQHPGGTTGTRAAADPEHRLWALPDDDPDLGAILTRTGRVTDLPTLDGLMQSKVPPGLGSQVRTGIAWPVDTRLDTGFVSRLRRAYATAPGRLTAAITPRGTVVDREGPTGTAAYKSPQGLPLLAYDERLSAIATATSDRSDGGATVQRFLAETLAIYQQQPAVDRSVLVAPPRGFAGDPDVLRDLFAQLRHTPWIRQTPAEYLLAQARHASRMTHPLAAPSQNPGGATDIRSYPSPGATPLTGARLRQVQRAMRRLDGIAGITAPGQPDLVGRPAAADRQLLSTRWRGTPAAWATLAGQVHSATRELRQAVHVVPSNVNFLADEGALQITVVNNLDAEVQDVDLELAADSPNLQIARQPGQLHIGAHSRTSVRVHVSALGSGDVPIRTMLTAPNGTRLGTQPSVIVHVQSTGAWIYWVVGIVAGLILALGLFRTFRRSRAPQRHDENGTHET